MFNGVDHVGIGVVDMGAALEFFSQRLGFSDVLFDHTGDLPGLEELTHRPRTRARVAMVASRWPTPLGPGRVKLVQVLEDGGTPAAPAGLGWGEVGICEVCLHARDVAQVHKELVETHGCTELMEFVSASTTPFDVSVDVSYIEGPGGGKIEILEWTGLWKALPGEPRLEGVNHVAFGVQDLAATREFYAQFGFSHLVFETNGYFEPMQPWFKGHCPACTGSWYCRARAPGSSRCGCSPRPSTGGAHGATSARWSLPSGPLISTAPSLSCARGASRSIRSRKQSMSAQGSGGTRTSRTPTVLPSLWSRRGTELLC